MATNIGFGREQCILLTYFYLQPNLISTPILTQTKSLGVRFCEMKYLTDKCESSVVFIDQVNPKSDGEVCV